MCFQCKQKNVLKSILIVSVTLESKSIPQTVLKPSTEVVYVQDRNMKTRKQREISFISIQKNNKKPKLVTNEQQSDSKTNSSISSPVSVTDSIITLPDSLENSCSEAPEKDPLADSDSDSKVKPITLTSLSFDFNDSSTPPPLPVIPTRRILRKRGREVSPEPAKAVITESKKMKMKGKRINTSLRRSIEEKKEQQASSSDEVQIVSETKAPKRTPKKKKGSWKKQKQQRRQMTSNHIEISDDDDDNSNKESKNFCEKDKDLDSVEISGNEAPLAVVIKNRPKGKNGK